MKIILDSLQVTAGKFHLNLSVTLEGRAVGLFGDSGAGKTTLIELLAGLRQPQAGRIQINDTVVADAAQPLSQPPEKRGIGYVPQDGALFPHLSVRQNLRYGRRPGNERAPLDARALPYTLEAISEALDITLLLDRAVTDLSGGERQRVALARALLARPRLLLLDEPLSSLDANHKSTILPLLQRIRDEFHVPLVYVSHSPEEFLALCDDVLVLHNGKALTHGAPATVFHAIPALTYRHVH